MKLKWLGHASFLIESASGTRIITDPYESGDFDGAIGYGPIAERADVVVVSHGHSDHNYVAGVAGDPKVVQGPGTCHVAGVEFNGVACFHDDSNGRERGKNTMFVFDVDGIRVCHVGDLGHQPSKTQLAALGPVDVLVLPVGGRFTIGAAEASKLAETISPRVIIPMHYRTDKCTLPISGVDEFLQGKQKVKRPGSPEIDLTRDSLPAETEIIVLEHAL